MARLIDLIGTRYGRLVVISREPMVRSPSGGTRSRWLVRCDCGAEKAVDQAPLRKGETISCGCIRHGHARHGAVSPEYSVWHSMMNRCTQPLHKSWPRYGGRGIRVCERWASFENFLEDMGPRPSLAHQIDRYPNNDGNYEPGNCRWARPVANARNRSDNRLITVGATTLTLIEWAERSGLGRATISRRLKLGWSPERAVTAAPEDPRATGKNAGEKHGLAKLTEATVRAIRQECAAPGAVQRAVARKYSVSFDTVSGIVLRKRWRHVT